MPTADPQVALNAWNPGIVSDLPPHLRALESLYLPNNSVIDYQQIVELQCFTGIKRERLATFTWQRLVLHELVVRVTANILVPEGDDEEILGQRFRLIIETIQNQYVLPHAEQISQAFLSLQEQIKLDVGELLDEFILRPPAPDPTISKPSRAGWRSWFSPIPKPPVPSIEEMQYKAIKALRELGLNEEDDYRTTLYKSLYVVLSAIATHRGRLPHDKELLVRLVSNHMSNDYGSRYIGTLLAPMVEEAITAQGYKQVQDSQKPILISLKGASAAGKSTLRPLLNEDILGNDKNSLTSQNFATISPDIWRRLLLDYASLGEDYKYSGRLTSHEVNVIDGKLDRYIRAKAEHRHSIPNLMVDRFRFDSFNSKKIANVLHGTYVHYVDTMHMYFVITPPEATVERGWLRGNERGRYKSVEDFLGHSVEAYQGMPRLFFKWLAYQEPHYLYHFVDNDVPKGTRPRLVAWGDQQTMNIIDPLLLSNIDRYQKINIHAQAPTEVYPNTPAMEVENNLQFLRDCIATLPLVLFVTAKGQKPYLTIKHRQATVVDADQYQQVKQEPKLNALFTQLFNTI